MSWKDISKSSYTVESVKFTLARPSHPFTIPYQGPKVVYSEGDELSSVADYRFDLDFTRIPLGPDHFPCGYWHKNYIPPFTIIYTSLMYPLEVVESVQTQDFILADGVFRSPYITFSYTESIQTQNFNLGQGKFSALVISYNIEESVNTTIFDISSGVFKAVVCEYSIEEFIETSTFTLSSGIFRDALLEYKDGEYEGTTSSTFELISGSHND